MRDLLPFIALGAALVSPQRGDALAQPQDATHLTLKQEFGRALFRTCQIDVALDGAAGHAKVLCLLNVVPSNEVAGQRELRPDEVKGLARLEVDSRLSGDSTGSNQTSVDGVFEVLSVTRNGRTVKLTTSGNPTFASGSRKELVERMRALLDELRRD